MNWKFQEWNFSDVTKLYTGQRSNVIQNGRNSGRKLNSWVLENEAGVSAFGLFVPDINGASNKNIFHPFFGFSIYY
jgi:hypothetical protein